MTFTVRDEQALVTAHQAGDPDAFAVIVASHTSSLFGHARRRLHDPEAARDALQETFLRAYRSIGRFGGDLYLGAWLHRILENVCNDEALRRRHEHEAIERLGSWPVDHVESHEPTSPVIASALQSIPETYREAVFLRAVDDLTFRDLAERTGISEDNARARFHRARALLRRLLDGTASLSLPVAGLVIERLRRARHLVRSSGSTTSSATAAPGSSQASVLLSSPATHAIVEVAAAPERTAVVAKVLLTVATAVPFMAAAAPSPSGSPPAAPAPVRVAAGALPSSGGGAARDDDGTAGWDAEIVDGLSAAPASMIAAPVMSPTAASGSGSTATTSDADTVTADAAEVDPASDADTSASVDTPATTDASTTDTTTTEPPPAPRLSRGQIMTTVAAPSTGQDEWQFEADVELVIDDRHTPGHLVGTVNRADDGSLTLSCTFTSADGELVLSADGHSGPTATAMDARSYTGGYDTPSGSAPEFAPSGRFRASIRPMGDTGEVRVALGFQPSAR